MSHILVVDDEQSSRTLLTDILASAGHRVILASHGEEALDVLRRRTDVRCIITDLKMPVMNGLRLIRAVRDAGDTIPIVAVSGANADQLLLAEDYGANAILVKPFDGNEVVQVVSRILAQTRSSWSDVWIHPEFGTVGEY